MIKFVHPVILVFLAVALALLLWYVYSEFRRNRQLRAFGNLEMLSKLMPTRSLLRQRLKFALTWFAFVAMVFVVARTQIASHKKLSGKSLNVELVAVVDVSNSMLCEDVTPSRLEKAKLILNSFIENTEGVKLGLVEFAGTSVTRMPLTTDYGTAKMFINSISTTDVSSQGTAVGAAIRQGQRCFSNADGVTKCMLILTDAENHEDDAVATTEVVCRDKKIIINVVGLGSSQGANILIGDSALTDADGKPVVTKLDENMAMKIANAGNGIYFKDKAPSDIINELYDQFQKVSESTSEVSSNAVTYVDIFEKFTWVAFLCLLADALLMERKNRLKLRLKDIFLKITKKNA